MAMHRVRSGQTTESLAASRRLYWKTVWEHPKNEGLRAKRKDPNLLHEGDEIFLPDVEPRDETCETTRRHTFKVRGIPSKLQVRFLDLNGEPRADEPYELLVDGTMSAGPTTTRGSLDGDGWVRANIHPTATRAVIRVGDPESSSFEEHVLMVGVLDPIDELSGVCDRLHNLGYFEGSRAADPADARLREAIARFRGDEGLAPSEVVDDELCDALKARHGG
ncbi:MAG: hypothetical protein U0414_10690 [Polyangiaceae bacterium]